MSKPVDEPVDESVKLSLGEPGTFIYTAERALAGHRLTQFGLSLRRDENRRRYLEDECAYMASFNLNQAEVDLVLARDWTGLLIAGGHLQSILKICATLGGTLWEIGAHNTGIEKSELMASCPRRVRQIPQGPA